MFYVYGHYKEKTKELFYIGAAKLYKRFNSKLSRNKYWKEISKEGYYYELLFNSESWEECLLKESELILKYGRLDNNTGVLCNLTNGGHGCVGLADESRLKISSKLLGIKRTDEFKANSRVRLLGKKMDIQTKQKISITHKSIDKSYLIGRKLSEETKKKISEIKKGKPIGLGKKLTDNHKKAISNGMKKALSENEIQIALTLYKSGSSFRKIAIALNSNHNTISKYITANL